MKGTLKIALGVALTAGLTLPMFGQQNFPDVPEYHWAYEAVKTLRDNGLIVGYPDGTYKGPRPMSRYEFAVAMRAAYEKLKMMNDGLGSRIDSVMAQIDEVKKKMDSMGGGGGGGDTDGLKAQLDALKSQLDGLMGDVNGMKGWKDDIDALKKLSSTFEQDLASLGVDVAAFKKDLASIESRVTALEKRKPAININGTMDVYGRAGHSRSDKFGVDWNGGLVGSDGTATPVGITRDLHFMHEIGLDLSGEFNGINVVGTVSVGNLLGFEGGNMTSDPARAFGANGGASAANLSRNEGNTDIFVNRLEANWNANMMGSPVGIRLGRIGNQINPYTLKRGDYDYYVDVDRYDDGNWYFDGGELKFNWKTVGFNVFAGKSSGRGSVNSSSVYGMNVGDLLTYGNAPQRPGNYDLGLMSVNTLIGANIGFNLGDRAKLGLNYNIFDGSNTTWAGSTDLAAFTFNRLAVWGGEIGFTISDSLSLKGYYARSDYQYNGDNRHDEDNSAFDGMLMWQGGNLGVFAGYRSIDPYFSAPGDWGRIGYWRNPRDVRGFQAGLNLKFNENLDAYASGEFYNGTGKAETSGGVVTGFDTDDKINRIQAGFGFKLGSAWHLGLGWEGVFYDIQTGKASGAVGGKTDENYYTADASYALGGGASWRIGYQVSDYRNKTGSGFWNTPGNGLAEAKGGLLFTQFSVKF